MVVYKIFYRRKKLLQLAWRKARCVGQAAVWTALNHRTCPGLPPSSGSGCSGNNPAAGPEGARADGLDRTSSTSRDSGQHCAQPGETLGRTLGQESHGAPFLTTCSERAPEDSWVCTQRTVTSDLMCGFLYVGMSCRVRVSWRHWPASRSGVWRETLIQTLKSAFCT